MKILILLILLSLLAFSNAASMKIDLKKYEQVESSFFDKSGIKINLTLMDIEDDQLESKKGLDVHCSVRISNPSSSFEKVYAAIVLLDGEKDFSMETIIPNPHVFYISRKMIERSRIRIYAASSNGIDTYYSDFPIEE